MSKRGEGGAAGPAFDDAFRAGLRDLFAWRRDVRHFRRDPVPAATLDSLLAMAAFAPSVGLSQPWRFVTVDHPARRDAVRASFARCNADALGKQPRDRTALYAGLKLSGLEEAPCQFALFVEPDPAQGHGLGRSTMPDTVLFSAVMALHTVWLAARAAGLGLGWVSILDPAAVAAALDVPADWRLIGYFCLGFPRAESDTPELEAAGWERRRSPATLRR